MNFSFLSPTPLLMPTLSLLSANLLLVQCPPLAHAHPLAHAQPFPLSNTALKAPAEREIQQRRRGCCYLWFQLFLSKNPLSDKEEKIWVGRVDRGGGGLEFRGTEGRPGLISSPSVQTSVCAMGPWCLPRQCPHPGLCPHPISQVVAPPQESLLQSPSLLLHPSVASCPIHSPSSPTSATLG